MSSGLNTEDYFYLKCWVALVKVGKKVLLCVLKKGFPNKLNLTLRDGLRALPDYSNSKFNRDFNKDERQKIESGNLDNFDITLLYTLIQRLCGLVPATDQITVNNANTKKISKLLLGVKNTRNKYAHPMPGMTEKEMIGYIQEMKNMFVELLDETTIEFNVDEHEINNLKNDVIKELQEVLHSPLPAATKKQIAAEKATMALQEGFKDLESSYQHMSEISVTPWPYVPCRQNIQKVFMKGKVKYTNSIIAQHRLTEKDSSFDVDDILGYIGPNKTETQFILITGKSGSGKSTLLKYITHSWKDPNEKIINNIEKYDFVIHYDCRDSKQKSLKDVLAQLMPNTALLFTEEELKNIVLTRKCLFLIDNIDELHQDCMNLITEIISSPNSNKILATATNDISNQITQKAQHRQPINFILESLNENSVLKFIELLKDSLPQYSQSKKIEFFITEILQNFDRSFDWLHNPEILSHVFFNWYFLSDETPRCSSLTYILLNSFNLILKKLKDRVTSRSISDIVEIHSLNIKLQSFLLELGRIAMAGLNQHTLGLSFKGTSQLILKCEQLDLPANIILSEFLCFRESFDEANFQKSMKITFPSITFQEFCSAYHIYSLLITSETEEQSTLDEIIASIHKEVNASNVKNNIRMKNIIKYLVGLLSISHQDILAELSNNVVKLLEKYCNMKTLHWFEILEEAQGHVKLTKEILNRLEDNWHLEDNSVSSLFVKLLSSCPPKTLQIVCMKDPGSLYHLTDALKSCSVSNNCINLSMMIYSQFWSNKFGYSDNFLKVITSDNSSCKLLHFAGRLSKESFKLIPTTLQKLALQVNVEDITELDKLVKKLDALQLLSLNITVTDSFMHITNLPRVSTNKNSMFSIDLFGCNDNNLKITSNLISKLSLNLTRLAIRKSNLDNRNCVDLINYLNSFKVSVNALVVGSIFSLTPHEYLNISADARNLLECKNFKWIVSPI